MGTLEMEGVPNGNNRTTMITSKLVSKDTDATLVNLALEINPLDRPEMDITVNAVLKPLQITYDFVSSACLGCTLSLLTYFTCSINNYLCRPSNNYCYRCTF